jgi:acyl-CoA thioesterase
MAGVFSQDIVVESAGEGRYRAALDHSWDLMPLPQGGIVVSFALRAAAEEVARAGNSQQLRTCTAIFAGRVGAGDLAIDTVVLRRGRSATQVMATVRNVEASSGTTVVAVYGSNRRGPSFVDLAPPIVPAPLECPSYRDPPPPGVEAFERLPFWHHVEGRAALGHAPWDEYEPGGSEIATWLRFDDPPRLPDGALDPLGVLTLADRMPGSVRERVGPSSDPWFAPSADLTVHFFAPARTEWLLAHDRARWADDGWASAETTLWDEDGALIAYATQMMIFTYLTDRGDG